MIISPSPTWNMKWAFLKPRPHHISNEAVRHNVWIGKRKLVRKEKLFQKSMTVTWWNMPKRCNPNDGIERLIWHGKSDFVWYYVVFLEERAFCEFGNNEYAGWLCVFNGVGFLHMLTGFEEKEKPENALFSGFLASPARFERAAFRLGAHGSIDKKAW